MLITRRNALTVALGCAATMATSSSPARTYPNKPVHLIVPYPAGGGTDFYARLVGGKMAELIGQPIVVENKPGAATNIAAEYVAKAPPDGHTILLGDMATFAVNRSLYKKLPFDPDNDFSPIALTARFLSVLVANPKKLNANSVAELVAAAKSAPGGIDMAHVGIGSPFHLAAVWLQQLAGIKLNEIPYRGAGPAVQGLLSGDAHVLFVDYATARSHIAAGSLKAIAVTTLESRPELRSVPPVAATEGLARFELEPWQGLVAPASTPSAIIDVLRNAHATATADPVVRQKLNDAGAEPLQSSPHEFAEHTRRETAKWAQIIAAGNVQVD